MEYSDHIYGLKIYTGDLDDTTVQKRIREDGIYDKQICDWVIKNIKSGDIVYDLGSNVGEISEISAKMGAKVYAFDANKEIVEKWQTVRSINNIDNDITIFAVGLSNTFETLKFYKSSNNVGGSTFAKDMIKAEPQYFKENVIVEELELVPMRSLDLSSEIPKLVKLDIQGFEEKAWDGMPDNVKNTQHIIAEMSRDYDETSIASKYMDNRFAYTMSGELIAKTVEDLNKYRKTQAAQFMNILFSRF